MNRSQKLFGSALAVAALALLVGYAPAPKTAPQMSNWAARPPVHLKNAATTTYQNGYSPAQLKQAYGINQLSSLGQGQTIAIVDAYGSPTIQQDITTFDSQFGLPSANLQIAYPNGQPHKTDGGWALETSLDVEWAHAIAPDAKILLVVAKSASTSNLVSAIDYATNHGAQVVSNSWGGSEFSGESSYDSHFQHSGVVYVASSGDSGAGSEWPAASPYVLGTGGTTLSLASNGAWGSETAWSGSGGATSTYEARPTYQNNWTSVVGSQRGIPDVAWDANPNTGVAVYDSTNDQGQSGWFEVGGTSVSSPCWSALIALADAGRTTPLTSQDAITQLYNLAGTTGSTGYTTYFHDITQGNNGGYSALPGYDLVTGLGSPQANNLIPALTAAP